MALSKIIPANRTVNITYAIRDIIVVAQEVAKTGKKLHYLNIGDPNVYDFVTPPAIIEATVKAMHDNKNGYSPSEGIPEAIDAIRMDAERKGIKNIQNIFVTTGAAEAIEICLAALLNSGDNFLMPSPGYPLYNAVQSKLETIPNHYNLDEENGWQPDLADIKAKVNSKTKAIVLINPNNPTGSVYSEEILRGILEIAIENDLVIFADEIYDKLLFGEKKMISIAALSEEASCITFSGMSKNYIAPGFRLGWGIMSGKKENMADYVDAINRMLRSRVSANHPEQYAIPVALNGDNSHLADVNRRLRERSDLVAEKISKIDGISLVKPEGAFYAFPKIDVKNDWDFCIQLLKATGVIVVPGAGFGQKAGTSHFRIVILPTLDTLNIAFDYIADFYKDYKNKE